MTKPRYRVIQQEWDKKRGKYNESVFDLDDLVTHHPEDNQRARLEKGTVFDGEKGRVHAMIGGEIQEIEIARNGRSFGLRSSQVLIKKDFMLEHSSLPSGDPAVRDVDVPSPVDGFVGRVLKSDGLVDIYDREGGIVIARLRHMEPIHVREGQTIEYGQSLGVQSDQKASAKHVHLEMDTRYYQQYESYISDLVNGRLSIDENRRIHGIDALLVFDDGTFRIGETNPRILELQEILISRGYLGANNSPLQADGVYRLEMQSAVLAFQRDHGIVQTGDIDRSTLYIALPLSRERTIDRMDHVERSRAPFMPAPSSDAPVHAYQPGPGDHRPSHQAPDPARTGRTPQYHDHPDHQLHKTPLELERDASPSPVQAAPTASALSREPDLFDRVFEALINKDDEALRAARIDYFQSPDGQLLLQEGRELRQAQERKADALALSQGRPLPTGYSIGTLTGKQDPRDWDHPDHALYSAIRRELPREVSDEMAAHVMLQARQAGIHNADRLGHVSVQNNQVFVGGRNFSGMTHVDLSQTPPPMEDTLQQSQRLDQQLALERQQWLAQQQEQARNGPSMSL